MIAIRLAAVILAALGIGSVPAHAQNFENIDRLEGDLVAVLGSGVGTPGGPATGIDRRLKLAPCPQRPAFDAPAMGAVAIRCPAVGWRIRVPLTRAAAPAAPALTGAPRGTEPVAPAIDTTPVVRRGDQVSLVANGRGFSISQAGTAEGDGAVGARIRVRTDPRKPAIIAEVVGPGEVRRAGLK